MISFVNSAFVISMAAEKKTATELQSIGNPNLRCRDSGTNQHIRSNYGCASRRSAKSHLELSTMVKKNTIAKPKLNTTANADKSLLPENRTVH